MKLLSKFKLGKVQIAALAVAALVIFVLVAGRGNDTGGGDPGPGDLDNGAVRACDTFAAGQASARSDSARLALADRVTGFATKSDNDAVRARAMELGRHADEGNAPWRTASSALTQACRDAGWTAP